MPGVSNNSGEASLHQRGTSITASSSAKNDGHCSQDSQGPFLLSHQLMGDSMFVRFADQILHQQAVKTEDGKFSNGHCVGGLTIEDLIQRVNHPTHRLASNILLLIGANNLLKGYNSAELRERMERLLDILRQKVHKVVVLTLPPIPRLVNEPSQWHHWEQHNEWMKSLDNG